MAGLVAGAAPRPRDELVHDVGYAGVGGGVGEAAGGVAQPRRVYVQVQRVETPAVSHHRVKHAESFALLKILIVDNLLE